jgi:hypothetical protein
VKIQAFWHVRPRPWASSWRHLEGSPGSCGWSLELLNVNLPKGLAYQYVLCQFFEFGILRQFSCSLLQRIGSGLRYFRHVPKVRKSACKLRHVLPSVGMYRLGSHWMDFREIWYWRLLWKSVWAVHSSITIGGKKWRSLTWRLSKFYCCHKGVSPSEIVSCCLDSQGGKSITRTRHIPLYAFT